MGSCPSKENHRSKEISPENIKNAVTGLSPKEVLDIQVSWKEMHNKPVDADVLIIKNFLEGCPSAVEKHSERLLGAIPMETSKIVWMMDKDAFVRKGATSASKRHLPVATVPTISLDESGHYTGHYTYKCAPGFREIIARTAEEMNDCVNSLHNPERFIDKILDLGRSHKEYGITRNEIARFGDAVLDSLKMQLGSSFSQSAQRSWGTMLDLMVETFCVGLRQESNERTNTMKNMEKEEEEEGRIG